MKRLLLVEDEPRVAAAIVRLLGGDYQVIHAPSGACGLDSAIRENPDLVLLDLHLPDIDGIEVCRRLREHPRARLLPVIMISGDVDVERRVEGLVSGADDYLSKPFHGGELRARVLARLRRAGMEDESQGPVTVGNLRVDPGPAEAWLGIERIDLTHLEFRLVEYFARNADKLVSRKQMLRDLWPDTVVSRRTIDTHVAKLRRKLAGFDGTIETVYGGGYMLRSRPKN